MAVLKDLIVHGKSHFINMAQFNTSKVSTIAADKGVFNKLIATDAEIGALDVDSLNANTLTAQNATVVGLLDVKGDLHTNSWTNANIANIGGSFYISPTVSTVIASNGTPMSITITGNSGARTFKVSGGSFVTDAVKIYDGTTTSTASWSVGSHVMITGVIRVGTTGVDYPLGTCTGYLTATLTADGFTVGSVNSAALETIISELGTSNLKSYEIKISMFEIGPQATPKPVGILLTSYGVDKSTYIDIYGGVNQKNSSTGFTDPNVRIGYLGGIPQYTDSAGNTHKPTGWGIYTDNGYFKGVVIADSGLIANFTINGSKMYSNNHSAYNTATTGIYIGDDYISFGSGGVTYFNTSGTGKIGPWTLSTTALYNGSTGINNTTTGVYLGYASNNTGLNISGGSAATTITLSTTNFTKTINGTSRSTLRVAIGSNFGMDSSGNIYANGANITSINAGNITAGDIAAARIQTNLVSAINAKVSDLSALTATIGGFKVDSTSIHTNGVAITSNADNSIALSSADFTRTVNGISRTGLRFAIGDKFGVTGDGILYASEAQLKNLTIYDSDGNKRAGVTTDGFLVYDGGSATTDTTVAEFGVETRIGQQGASRVELTSNTIALIAENGSDALRAVTSGREIGAYSPVNTFYTRLASGTSTGNVFTIDLSSIANGKPFIVTIESRYGYTYTISTASTVWSGNYSKVCNEVEIGFVKGQSANSNPITIKMVSAISAQYGYEPFVTRTDKTVTVAYNASTSKLTITAPTYPTIADSQYAYGNGTNYVTNGDSYLRITVVSAYFSKLLPQTEIRGHTLLDMNTGADPADEIDDSILASLNALGWATYCIE